MRFDLVKPNHQTVLAGDKDSLLSFYILKKAFCGQFRCADLYDCTPLEACLTAGVQNDFVSVHGDLTHLLAHTIDLATLPNWHFGTVYGFALYRGAVRTIDLSALMEHFHSDTIFDAFSEFQNTLFLPEFETDPILLGVLAVVSETKTVKANRLIVLTDDLGRSLSPCYCPKHTDELTALEAVFDSVVSDLHTDPGYVTANPIQYIDRNGEHSQLIFTNYPFTIKAVLNGIMTASGHIPYETVGCVGFGRFMVYDPEPFAFLQVQLPNRFRSYGTYIYESKARVILRWLFTKEIPIINDEID